MEIVLWFRNHEINNYLRALDLINQGKNVIIDIPFYQYQLYLDLYIKKPFVKNIFYNILFVGYKMKFRYTLSNDCMHPSAIKYIEENSELFDYEILSMKECRTTFDK